MSAGTVTTASNAYMGGRLRYADPRDLPSFPSLGIRSDNALAAASTAASLGWANQKALTQQKDDATASAAALLTRDSTTPAAWHSDHNATSARMAQPATHAAARPAKQQLPAASAANQAFKAHPSHQDNHSGVAATSTALNRQKSLRAAQLANQRTGPRPRAKSGPVLKPSYLEKDNAAMAATELNRQKSLKAAQLADQRSGRRPRATSGPMLKPSYPDEANAAAHALSAATLAHKQTVRRPADETGAVPYTTMDRQMFTSHPPVKLEVDEQRRADVIHASALAMAKRMYNQQQRVIDATKQANPDPNSQRPVSADITSQPAQYTNLQEAAYKLAQERLAKLHQEHQQNRDFQEYYGSPGTAQRRFTIRTKLRRRASSDGAVIEDRKRSQQIREQMSSFSTRLSEVDEQKRRKDRELVLATAQRNVQAQLKDMDERVYAVTGKVTPTLLNQWELKAHAAAQARSEARKDDNAGKVDVGGGLYMDKKAVEGIAAKRVQPLIDDINDKAEKERERLAAQKMDEEARQREAEREKARDKEIRDIHEKIKREQREKDKLRKDELKQEEKARKQQEKATKAEQKRQSKEESRVSKETAAAFHPAPKEHVRSVSLDVEKTKGKEPGTQIFSRPTKLQTKHKAPGTFSPTEKSPTSEESSSSFKVKSWLKSRFTRPRSKTEPEREKGKQWTFIGGQKLMHADGTGSLTSLNGQSSSMREVAMAGRSAPLQPTPRPAVGFLHGDEPGESSRRATGSMFDEPSPVSSMSSSSSEEQFVEAREIPGGQSSLAMTPPRAIRDPAKKKSASPVRDSRFLENL